MALQLWLPLTKDLRNQGVNNITVINHGATYSSTGGKLGGAYIFDGTDDYLVGTYNATANISFTAWIKTNISIQVGCSGSGSGYPSFNYNWVANTWYHICVTYNTTEVKCYVNGELICTSTGGKGVACGTCNFTLGSR
jgi:hypothetical protein